jgi:DNA recombination protein RmuC
MQSLLPLLAGALVLALGYWLGRRSSPVAGLQAQLDADRASAEALRERAARAEAQAEEARRQLAEDQNRLEKLKAEMGSEAAAILEKNRSSLREEAGQQFDKVLAPLRQNLEDLKRLHESGVRGQAGLAEQLRGLTEAHQAFSAKAEELSLSLRGNVKAQGQWGEVLLERVLELSGLAKGSQYVLQGEGLDLRDESGALQKPDAVILLPDGKHLIVDAKAPLDGYFTAVNATDDAARAAGAGVLVKALKAQISGLAARNYPANGKLGSPDFTLLFVPIEAALGSALQAEPTLFENAWERRVVLVGPNMLFGTLKVIGQLWSQEKRNKNAEEIAKRGGALYDKLASFAEEFSKAKQMLESAQLKLVKGPGNVIRQAEMLKELGAKTDKSLPPAWVEKADSLD